MMKSEAEIYEAVARGWCHDANSAKEMDVLLGEAIAIEVLKVIRPLVAERDALAAENVQLRETDKHRMEFRWMDMTPDDGLPERILSGYLDYSEWTDNALGMEPSNPLIVQMNRDRAKRNAIIEQALAALSPQPSTASPSAPEGVSGDSELERLQRVEKIAKALYGAGYWSRSSQGYKDEDDRTYWDAMKAALAEEASHE